MATKANVVPVAPAVVVTENDPIVATSKPYVDPDAVFNEIPITTLDMLTDLAKNKFSSIIVAGHNTDSDIAGFRTTLLRDLVATAHKQLVTRVKDKTEKNGRTFYRELRARGISVCDAIRMSDYRPDDVICTCAKCIPPKPETK